MMILMVSDDGHRLVMKLPPGHVGGPELADNGLDLFLLAVFNSLYSGLFIVPVYHRHVQQLGKVPTHILRNTKRTPRGCSCLGLCVASGDGAYVFGA